MLLSVKQMSCIMFYKPTRNQTLPSRHEFTLAKLVFLFEKYKKIEIIHKKYSNIIGCGMSYVLCLMSLSDGCGFKPRCGTIC